MKKKNTKDKIYKSLKLFQKHSSAQFISQRTVWFFFLHPNVGFEERDVIHWWTESSMVYI